MNKEYTYIDGKVIVKDENGTQIPIEYYDNLDEVLIQENLIETIEDRISYLEKESQYYKIYNKKYNKKHYIPIILILGVLTTIIGGPAIFYFLGNTDIYTSVVNTIFGTMNEAVFFSSVFSILYLPAISVLELNMYCNHKNLLKKEKGINSELEFLKRQIVNERKKLVELTKEKTRDNENKEFRVVKVNDLEKLKTFKSWLNLYYDLGYNGEKYYKYYFQGKLDDKLSKHYNNTGIEVAKEYLEEKGPSLVKRKK